MQTIIDILKRAGGWHPGLYLKIDNAPYMELVIEAMDESGPMGLPAVSVAHYGEQNGDLMRDPEMCFELGLAGGAHLNPFYWRNDYVAVEQWSRNIIRDHYVHLVQLHEEHMRFAKTWDACTAPTCYQAKVDAHVAKTIAAKPKLVQISTAYGQQKEGSATLPRNKYTEIHTEKPTTKQEATRPEFKTCKHTTEAIVSEGIDKGELRKVCTEPNCPVHHPKQRPQKVADDTKWKAEQEKQRKEAAMANTTGIRILAAITAAVPVRLMKRDLLFVVDRLATLLDENRLAVVAKQHGIKKAKDSDSIAKLFAAYLRRAEESALGRVLVELTILHAATRQNAALVLRDAATLYKVDTDAITLKVKQEFAVREKARKDAKPAPKNAKKAA